MFDYFRHFLETEDTKILFILALICTAMVIDFFTGTFAAKINPDIEFKSKIGINGILRKLTSIFYSIVGYCARGCRSCFIIHALPWLLINGNKIHHGKLPKDRRKNGFISAVY